MPLVDAKCTNCGANLKIDDTNDAAICEYCGSAFVVEKVGEENGVPAKFILHGAGWGHGVGLCQIGAAVMGEQGYKYKEILLHYFVGASIESRY